MSTDSKITIFDLLKQIDKKNFQYTEQEDTSKAFVPFLALRWMTGTDDAEQVFLVNEAVNPYVFSLYRHKDLIWRLMCASSTNRTFKYTWVKQSKQSKNNLVLELITEYYQCSKREASSYMSLLSEEDIFEMAAFLGKDKDEMTKLKKELKP